MAGELQPVDAERAKALAAVFFPDQSAVPEDILPKTVRSGELFFKPEKITAYLQTMYFEEHYVEVEIDLAIRKFFAILVDDLPPLDERMEAGGIDLVETEYESGSYLKKCESVLLSPLIPAIGNSKVRNSNHVILRFFTGTASIELGCTFRDIDVVREMPVLRFNFPQVGRINRGIRLFRVKALSSVDAKVKFLDGEVGQISSFQLVDISAEGLGIEFQAEASPFQLGEHRKMHIKVEGIDVLRVAGIVRRILRIRDIKGYKWICGIQFDLENHALATSIERLTAAIQRLHLRELSEKMADLAGVSIIR